MLAAPAAERPRRCFCRRSPDGVGVTGQLAEVEAVAEAVAVAVAPQVDT